MNKKKKFLKPMVFWVVYGKWKNIKTVKTVKSGENV